MSSEVEFFDILYLGTFVTLSRAFDCRFYGGKKLPPTLVSEMNHALGHFDGLLLTFASRFIILLGGQPVRLSYVVDRLLGEFAAASVVFARSVGDLYPNGTVGIGVDLTPDVFAASVEGCLQESRRNAFHYYSRCLDGSHSHFLWTGPIPQIVPRSARSLAVVSLGTFGELLDYPGELIYPVDLELGPSSPVVAAQSEKRRLPENAGGSIGNAKKQKPAS